MSSACKPKTRMVADPSIGVSDLQDCLKTFLDAAQAQKPICLLQFLTPPSGVTAKSAPCGPWLVQLAPLLALYLGPATNGVIPSKRHKQALQNLDEKMGLNNTKKSTQDWVDLCDDWLRLSLAQLRSLLTTEGAKQRLYRKLDADQQATIDQLLSKLDCGSGLASRSSAEDLESNGSPSSKGLCLDMVCVTAPIQKSTESSSRVVDPAAVFRRVLERHESIESEVSSCSQKAVAGPKLSPEKGLLPITLLQSGDVSSDEAAMLEEAYGAEPPAKKAKVASGKGKGLGNKKKPAVEPERAADLTEAKAVRPGPPKGKMWKPDDELPLPLLRKRLTSRAYHRAFDRAKAEGATKEAAQEKAREASALASAKFDEDHPKKKAKRGDE